MKVGNHSNLDSKNISLCNMLIPYSYERYSLWGRGPWRVLPSLGFGTVNLCAFTRPNPHIVSWPTFSGLVLSLSLTNIKEDWVQLESNLNFQLVDMFGLCF